MEMDVMDSGDGIRELPGEGGSAKGWGSALITTTTTTTKDI